MEEHFERDLQALSEIKGKFLLSSYPSQLLSFYTQKCGWYTKKVDKPITANGAKGGAKRKRKTEVLTANYPI